MSRRRADTSKFERLEAAAPQAQPIGPTANRQLAPAAVRDPYGIEVPARGREARRVRVTVNLDALDRLLQARRIGPGEHAAGRTYQRLLEISLGASALARLEAGPRGGVRTAHSDDILARSLELAGLVLVELVRIRRLVGARSERLLRCVLVEPNPNTGRGWTLEELATAQGGSNAKHRIFALSQRLVEALEDLAAHWRAVEIE
jgi:hypothetical protein